MLAPLLLLGVGGARAEVTTFTGVWDPTVAANGLQLRATDPNGSTSIAISSDGQTLVASLTLNGCYTGCGAFYFDTTGALDNLPHGLVQFDWYLQINELTTDGQINIDGIDPMYNAAARDIWLYPSSISGSASIDYEGGPLSLFEIAIGAADTGSTTATITLANFSAPSSVLTVAQTDAPTGVMEPAGWTLLAAGLGLLARFRRRRVSLGPLVGA